VYSGRNSRAPAGLTEGWNTTFFTYDARTMSGTHCRDQSGNSPGIYPLDLEETHPREAKLLLSERCRAAGKYPSVAVTVAKRYTEPVRQVERIRQITIKQDVFRHTIPIASAGKFRPPWTRAFPMFWHGRTFTKVSEHAQDSIRRSAGYASSAANAGTVFWQVRCISKNASCSTMGKDCDTLSPSVGDQVKPARESKAARKSV